MQDHPATHTPVQRITEIDASIEQPAELSLHAARKAPRIARRLLSRRNLLRGLGLAGLGSLTAATLQTSKTLASAPAVLTSSGARPSLANTNAAFSMTASTWGTGGARFSFYHSGIIDAPVTTVWATMRDVMQLAPILFPSPDVEYGWYEGGSAEKVPAQFWFTLQPGDPQIVEEVSARSELDYSMTIRSLTPVLGVAEDYVATFRLKPITTESNKTFLEWERSLRLLDGVNPEELVPLLDQAAEGEVVAVQRHFAELADDTDKHKDKDK